MITLKKLCTISNIYAINIIYTNNFNFHFLRQIANSVIIRDKIVIHQSSCHGFVTFEIKHTAQQIMTDLDLLC